MLTNFMVIRQPCTARHNICVCVTLCMACPGEYLLTEEEAVATQSVLLWLSNMMSLMGAFSTSSNSLVRLASWVLHTDAEGQTCILL